MWANTDHEALFRYELVFEQAAKFSIQFKPTKCVFFSQDLEILGHHVTPLGRFPTSKGTEAISAMPHPHNVSSVKRFLGMVNYFRDYVRNMASRTKHLHSFLCKGVPFVWTDAHEAEFCDLKDALISPDTMLYHPDWNSPFELHTDASKHGIGAMLAQCHEGALCPVKFASRSFTPVEGHWPTTHQELFAVKYSLEHFRPYLLGRAVTIITDHANLQWLTSISPQQSKLARWCLSMAEFDFQIKHHAGSANVVPEVLSWAPLTHPSTSGEDLCFPPQTVTCFITTLIGFDIPYLEPSQVSEIFSDSLTCLTLACNPTALLSLATCPKPYPSGFPTGNSSLPNPTSQKDPLAHHLFPEVAPPALAKPEDPQSHYPLNFSRALLATKQQEDKWLGPLYHYLLSGGNVTELAHLTKSDQSWVKSTASQCKIVDDHIMYSDILMDDPNHLRIFVPSNIELQRHLLHAYHDSSIGMHRGHDATYNSLSHDFYWRHMHKHVRNWVCCCPQCIRFKSLQSSHGPMQLRLYQHPFHTLGVDYVGELPPSPSGNKLILTAVGPYSNYLRAIPVPDKTATTAVNALFHDVFLQLGFPSVLQSNHGGEFLNALLHRITQLLSIEQVFTFGFVLV